MVAIGNAPTALFHLLELIHDGGPRPAAIIGMPVGFVGSAESKEALAGNPWSIPYAWSRGRRGGSAMAASAVNALAREEETVTGRLYGVGVGPGDPELITRQGRAADQPRPTSSPTTPAPRDGRSPGRSPRDLIRDDAIEELLIYPGDDRRRRSHPLGYYGADRGLLRRVGRAAGKHLDAGRTVVVLAEGDPLFYSSYMYLHDRLADRFRREVVPGVTSVSAAAAAAAGTPLARHEDVLTVLPGHPAGAGAGPPARRHRGRGDHEAGPHLRRRPGGPAPGRPARRRPLRRAGDHRR